MLSRSGLSVPALVAVLLGCGGGGTAKDAAIERPCGVIPATPATPSGELQPVCPKTNCSTCQGTRLLECDEACYARGCWSCVFGEWVHVAVDCYPQACWPDSGGEAHADGTIGE